MANKLRYDQDPYQEPRHSRDSERPYRDHGRQPAAPVAGGVSMSGTIKRIVKENGFGFIRDTEGREYFFHRSACDGQFELFQDGMTVDFVTEVSLKGPRAAQVTRRT